jgi:signal transduction histidine kinase
MKFEKLINQIDIYGDFRKYGLPFWQCPQFLFLIMGAIIIVSSLVSYGIGQRYVEDPYVVALMVLGFTAVLFIIAVIVIRSFEKLAEANRMKSEFVSVVSHQLRSPLSNLKWAIEILMSGKITSVNEKQLEYLQILRENSRRMEGLISDLLIVSRIQQGKYALREEKVSFRDLVEKVIENARIFSKASNVEIKLEAKEELSQIFIDPFQIKLVIENLLDNAIRYTKEGGSIEIKMEKKNNDLRFEIRDNGVGIPKEDQKYIFQKFFRSENVLKYQTDGSGLGLYIAKSIIEKSKGKIGFKSQEGVGSTFWFTLPIAQ